MIRPTLVRCPLLAAILTVGCVGDLQGVPQVGDCAAPPEGRYTFGTLGIGTCLSGPTDARFFQHEGETWLAISNADPFRDFSGGSLLLLPAAQVLAARGDVDIADLEAYALDTEPYIGRIGLLPTSDGVRALLPGRASEDSFLVNDDDRAWNIDLSDPRRPRYGNPRFVPTPADPYAIEIDPSAKLGFVIQSTALSATIVDLASDPIDLVDPMPQPRVASGPFTPAPGSQGLADLQLDLLPNATISRDHTWTVQHVPDTARMWIPTADGLYRYLRRDGRWEPVPFGLDLDLTRLSLDRIADPFLTLQSFEEGEVLSVLFSDGTDIRRALTDGSAGTWSMEVQPIVRAPGEGLDRLSSPSLADSGTITRMFVDVRPEDSERSAIHGATSADGALWSLDPTAAIVPPEGFEAVAQPMVLRDPHTDALRMWLSMYDGQRWSLGHAWSTDDGRTWQEPTEIRALDGTDLGGAYVVAVAGEYRLWLSAGDGDDWRLLSGTSADGLDWAGLEDLGPLDTPLGLRRPPRVAMQPAGAGGWRLTRLPDQVESELAEPGVTWPTRGNPPGFTARIASGHHVGTSLLPDSDGGVIPGTLRSVSGADTLYATVVASSGRPRLAALRWVGDDWQVARDDLLPAGGGGNVAGASSPAVARTSAGYAMAYAVDDATGVRTMRVATSTDGLNWSPIGTDLLGDLGGWASNRREPGTLQVDGDTWTLWFSGFDGVRWRIGQAQSTDAGRSWSFLPGRSDPWIFDGGDAGTFDDSGVRTPTVLTDGDDTVLYYSGFDGESWRIGRARQAAGRDVWQRTLSPVTGRNHPVLSQVPGTFANRNIRYPVPGTLDGDPVLLYAGSDGRVWRTGIASRSDAGIFPAHRVARPGDGFTFETYRGRRGRSEINLSQVIDGFALPGASGPQGGSAFQVAPGGGLGGPGGIGGAGGVGGAFGAGFGNRFRRDGYTSAVLDAERGLMYVGSKDLSGVLVVDVRDDSAPGFRDENAFGIEAVLRFDSTTGNTGVQDLTLGSDNLLYGTMRAPDAVAIIDLSLVEDDATPRVIDGALRATLPMKDRTKDRGEETFAQISGAGLARLPGRELLLATHFRDNSLSVFDTRRGAWGQEIRYIRDVAENPHIVRIDPSGDFAVVLGYLSADVDRSQSSTLVVVDLREGSPTRFEPLARIANR